jgi:hypothetical protein
MPHLPAIFKKRSQKELPSRDKKDPLDTINLRSKSALSFAS